MRKKARLIVIFLTASLLIAFPTARAKKRSPATNANEIFAKYLKEAQFDDFPPEVIEKAKFLILDSIGCALGGTQTNLGKSYLELAKNWGGGLESTVIGDGAKVTIMNAAYVNTQLANLLDFDDTYDFYPPGHPGSEIIQTALAMGEAINASGKEFLTAVILGYEITLRAGRAAGSILWQSTLNTSSGILGPAAVSSRLLNLDREAISNAFRLAQSGGINPPKPHKHDIPKSMVVPKIKGHYGIRSLQGILAARQAQQGLTGWKGLLDFDRKAWYLAGGEVDNYDILTQGLGKTYRILEVSFKPTPSCRWSHVPITAAWEALENKPVKGEEISEILIKGVERLKRYNWETMLQAQFSIPCAVALAISGEEPGPGWYTTGRFKDADIRDLASKVKFEHDPRAEELELKEGKMICTVEIRFKDGKVKKASIDKIKGAPDNPMSDDELKAKFRANATSVIGEAQIEQVIDMILNLEKLTELSLLTALLD